MYHTLFFVQAVFGGKRKKNVIFVKTNKRFWSELFESYLVVNDIGFIFTKNNTKSYI